MRGGTGVEPYVRFTRHQRVCGKAGVLGGVGHDEQPVIIQRVRVQGVGAEGDIAGGLFHIQPDAGLEPLPVGVHQADQGDGDAADV